MRSFGWQSLALAAVLAAPLLACSDTPLEPHAARAARPVAHTRVAGDTTITTTVRRAGTVYEMLVQRQCTAGAVAAARAAVRRVGVGNPIGAPGTTAALINNGGSPWDCGCPATTTPPSWLPGWTCKLTSYSCTKDKTQVSCNYKCEPPTFHFIFW